MPATYTEPQLTIAILDYAKPIESRLLLESVKRHVKVPHKVIFCDNGSGEDYSLQFLRDGLVDQLLINHESFGLGIGTRDLINACQTEFFAYVQNDQIFCADLDERFFSTITERLNQGGAVRSITLAGYPCGPYAFSERAHVMRTDLYKSLEPLSIGGAGRFHELPWREGQIQQIYREHNWVHFNLFTPAIVQDNGVFAVRDMGAGGVWCHRTDDKSLWCIVPPTEKNLAYPKINDEEYELARNGAWPDGRVPAAELEDRFRCWDQTILAQMQDDYIKDLRRRFAAKRSTS